MPSPGERVPVIESLNRHLNNVSMWSHLWEMKLNASKTKIMMVSRSHTIQPQSTPLTLGGTVLKESAENSRVNPYRGHPTVPQDLYSPLMQCPCGTILQTLYSMVWDRRVSSAEKMLIYWPKLLYYFLSSTIFIFLFFLSRGWYCGAGV